MSAQYWKDRWIAALVQSGVEQSAAEAAYAMTYKTEPADYSKSPEIQAFMHSPLVQNSAPTSTQQRAAH